MKRLVFYMIAAPIILLLVFMLFPAISNGRPSRKTQCVVAMRFIASAIQRYENETGEYPTGNTASVLLQLSNTNLQGYSFLYWPHRKGFGPYEFVDPWGTPFQIQTTFRTNYLIRSAGKNGDFDDMDDLVLSKSTNNFVNP